MFDAQIMPRMKTTITIRMETDLLSKVRELAAEEGVSVSALLTEHLQRIVHQRRGYDRARMRALARLREGVDLNFAPPRSRDEIHER